MANKIQWLEHGEPARAARSTASKPAELTPTKRFKAPELAEVTRRPKVSDLLLPSELAPWRAEVRRILAAGESDYRAAEVAAFDIVRGRANE